MLKLLSTVVRRAISRRTVLTAATRVAHAVTAGFKAEVPLGTLTTPHLRTPFAERDTQQHRPAPKEATLMAAAADGSSDGEKETSTVLGSAIHIAPVTCVPCTPALVPVAPADGTQRGGLSPGQALPETPAAHIRPARPSWSRATSSSLEWPAFTLPDSTPMHTSTVPAVVGGSSSGVRPAPPSAPSNLEEFARSLADWAAAANRGGAPADDAVTVVPTMPLMSPTTDIAAADWQELLSSLHPPARTKRPRRWLSSDQKTHRCNIDGCTKAYGSASSLCAHKRAHHPGWKERRHEDKGKEAAADPEERDRKAKEPRHEEELMEDGDGFDDEDDDESDPKTPKLHSSHVATLSAELRTTPTGQWLELLAADSHGRLGALRRSRQRAQKTYRDAHQAYTRIMEAIVPGDEEQQVRFAQAAAATASLRLLREMDLKLESEILDLEAWLALIDQMGSAVAAGLLESTPQDATKARKRLEMVMSGAAGGPPMSRHKLEQAKEAAVASATTIASMALWAVQARPHAASSPHPPPPPTATGSQPMP